MATTLYFVQGDTLPQIKLTLTDSETQAPRDLSGKTVYIHCKPVVGSGIRFAREAIFPSPTDRANGIAYIQWQDGDLNRAPGEYNAEIEILGASGRETIYDLIKLVIREDIGDITPYPSPAPPSPSPSGPDPTV